MSLEGKVIAISGTLSKSRKTITAMIVEKGGKFSASLSKKVTHLVVADPSADTAKIQKARQMKSCCIVGEAWLDDQGASASLDSSHDTSTEELALIDTNPIDDDNTTTEEIGEEADDDKNSQENNGNPTTEEECHDVECDDNVESGESTEAPLNDLVIALAGRLSKPAKVWAKVIVAQGGTYAASVTKKVTHLVTADLGSNNNKMKKARENGIHIVTEDFLLKL